MIDDSQIQNSNLRKDTLIRYLKENKSKDKVIKYLSTIEEFSCFNGLLHTLGPLSYRMEMEYLYKWIEASILDIGYDATVHNPGLPHDHYLTSKTCH